ncbi:CMGC family protein kinase [Tritrichomonas foetus]|uniref:dual-specificity kinase n=1 Tax=Tritrichomonas foetus TaxID=1144522 RepID=A0A1J4JDH2_9EUKA|nr:CMGC family protein kinase [Tritrichomonas foetus]|eukprot:OHS96705.1 CMGC family protein kinase [Tritrichomonas foetus]
MFGVPNFPVQPPPNPPTSSRRYDREEPTSGRPRPPSYAAPRNDPSPRARRPAQSARTQRANMNPVIPNGPISPQTALQKYPLLLLPFEKKEIVNFPEIYFLGKQHHKIEPDPENQYNQGFDDDSHNMLLVVGNHLAYRFEIMALFGAGAFGQVIRCFDHKTKKTVAVKVIVNTEQMHEQGLIEAQILAILNKNNSRHIVQARDFFIFRSHICISFEILGMNLFELSESYDYKPLSIRSVRLYALQMYEGLETAHRNAIVHCDIKPENVLLVPGSQSLIKVIDWGSGCFAGHQKYEYIQSRFYRAPEVMLGIDYGPPMDVWSAALVIIELLIGRPLFPGDDELDELHMISELLGEPPIELVKKGKRRDEFFDENFKLKENAADRVERKPGSMCLKEIMNVNDDLLIDFLMKCLTWDQTKRITSSQALQHPWVKSKEINLANVQGSRYLPRLLSAKSRY